MKTVSITLNNASDDSLLAINFFRKVKYNLLIQAI